MATIGPRQAQLLAHLLGGLTDVAGEQRLAMRLGVLADGLLIHRSRIAGRA